MKCHNEGTDQLNLLQGRSDASYRIGIGVSAGSGSIQRSRCGRQSKRRGRVVQRRRDAGRLHGRRGHGGCCNVEARHSFLFFNYYISCREGGLRKYTIIQEESVGKRTKKWKNKNFRLVLRKEALFIPFLCVIRVEWLL